MFRLNSAYFSLAAEFTGQFSPCQGVELAPHPSGQGVTIVSVSDGAAMVFLGYDSSGICDEPPSVFLPGDDIPKAGRGIKTAERELTINGSIATVTEYKSKVSSAQEFSIARTSTPLPPIPAVIRKAVKLWGEAPELVETTGRYSLPLLTSAVKSMVDRAASVSMYIYPDGPMRLQRDDMSVVVLLMPQTAVEVPPLPRWLLDYGDSGIPAS